jgi:hypothetical protein
MARRQRQRRQVAQITQITQICMPRVMISIVPTAVQIGRVGERRPAAWK